MDWISVITIIATTVVTFFVGRLLARVKGGAGEMVVSRRLRRLPEEEYRVFDNVILPTPRGSSQIDHLVVSVYGIFVIETKNYKGWLYGGEKSEYWTQNIYGQKYKLYNPIFQNAGHIRALRRVLQIIRTFRFILLWLFPEGPMSRLRQRLRIWFIGAALGVSSKVLLKGSWTAAR